jgi:ribosomal 50S subunit-recycling heat shock protein
MRLDQFLRASRLVVRRTVAQELCAAGAVEVNGAAARSSRAVRAGDEIRLRRRHRLLTVRVLELPAARQTSRAAAASLYEVVSDERTEDAGLAGVVTGDETDSSDDETDSSDETEDETDP